jgi:hypothetical protein
MHTTVLSDIEIAQAAPIRHIKENAASIGIKADDLEYYGKHNSKLPLTLIDEEAIKQHHLILVTAITPTPLGEGKTTVAIRLAESLNRIKKKTITVLRESSLGPVFGVKGGAAGSKNNFGFNVKYNKAKTNLQGNMNIIVRRLETDGLYVYQIKGNVMTSLVVSTSCPKTATFNGKANITDITNQLAPVAVDGNATLQVKMTDMGEPGSSDKIAITVWNKSAGMWFASNWNGTTTLEQILGGGNLKLHGEAVCTPPLPVTKII